MLANPNTPLRLADAVALAFPFGGMTVSGLRREIARGRLVVEVMAGKQFTTLAAIEEMRRLCRAPAPMPIPTGKRSEKAGNPAPAAPGVAAGAFQLKLSARGARDAILRSQKQNPSVANMRLGKRERDVLERLAGHQGRSMLFNEVSGGDATMASLYAKRLIVPEARLGDAYVAITIEGRDALETGPKK